MVHPRRHFIPPSAEDSQIGVLLGSSSISSGSCLRIDSGKYLFDCAIRLNLIRYVLFGMEISVCVTLGSTESDYDESEFK
ncbi:hypothetical protein Tco_0383468 [Tanacetum coccineum]